MFPRKLLQRRCTFMTKFDFSVGIREGRSRIAQRSPFNSQRCRLIKTTKILPPKDLGFREIVLTNPVDEISIGTNAVVMNGTLLSQCSVSLKHFLQQHRL